MTYSDKLRDPRWQKLRLEVMSRAGFRCENCGDENSTLHAHHNYYVSKRDPWEYPIGSLSCLCENCHSEITQNKGREPIECEAHEILACSEWEYAALLALRCESAASRNEGHCISEVISALCSSGFPDVEVVNVLGRLALKNADNVGLVRRLIELEKEGLL